MNAQKTYQLPSNVTSNDYMAKTIIIKVKPAFASVCSNNKIENASFVAFANAVGVTNLHKKFPLDKSPEKPTNVAGQKYADLSLIYELNYTSTLSILNYIIIIKPYYNQTLLNSTSLCH